jgi:cell division septation protein DedD
MMAVLAAATWYGVIALQARSASAPGDSGHAGGTVAPAPSPPPAASVPAASESVAAQPTATSGSTPGDVREPFISNLGEPVETPGALRQQRAAGYSVLVGSFRQELEATTLVEQLRGLGYRARTGRIESDGRGAWHQVFVGPYTAIEQARQDEGRVRQMPGYADARLTTH